MVALNDIWTSAFYFAILDKSFRSRSVDNLVHHNSRLARLISIG